MTTTHTTFPLGARVICPDYGTHGTVVDRKRSLGADMVAVQWDDRYVARWEFAHELTVAPAADHVIDGVDRCAGCGEQIGHAPECPGPK